MLTQPWKTPPADFTIFRIPNRLAELDNPHFGKFQAAQDKTQTQPIAIPSYSGSVSFRWKTVGPLADLQTIFGNEYSGQEILCVYKARALICLCWRQKHCSLTLRLEEPLYVSFQTKGLDDQTQQTTWKPEKGVWAKTTEQPQQAEGHPDIGEVNANELLKAYAPFAPKVMVIKKGESHLFPLDDLANTIFPAIFTPAEEASGVKSDNKLMNNGLIVVSGQTGSLKSQLLWRLVELYLCRFDFNKWGKLRYPHVITIEDPIETPLVSPDDTTAKTVDFTPREIGKDVTNLKEGLTQALRQTPAVVIVGETRDQDDWKDLLDFAATGHLCFTTTHAGSLVETMRKIIDATRATTPDLRSSLAEKILAVIHLRKFSLTQQWNGENCNTMSRCTDMLLPAIWRNAHGGANFFVSDGLSAILPRRAGGVGRPAASCRGRVDFAEAMLSGPNVDVDKDIKNHIYRLALKDDLEGV